MHCDAKVGFIVCRFITQYVEFEYRHIESICDLHIVTSQLSPILNQFKFIKHSDTNLLPSLFKTVIDDDSSRNGCRLPALIVPINVT